MTGYHMTCLRKFSWNVFTNFTIGETSFQFLLLKSMRSPIIFAISVRMDMRELNSN